MSSLSFEKGWFALSVVVLSFLYGTAVGKWEWFPYSFLDQAIDQARVVYQSRLASDFEILQHKQTYQRRGVRAPKPEAMQPGLTLISSMWKGSDGWEVGLKLVDKKGKVVHEWLIGREEIFSGSVEHRWDPKETDVQGVYLFPNGDVLMNLEWVGMARLNPCGEVLWTLLEGNHHSIERAEDGTFWVPGTSPEPRLGTEHRPDGLPGLEGPVWHDRILQIDEGGNVLAEINVFDVLYKNDIKGPIIKYGKNHGKDITHMNDIEPLPSSIADEYPLFESGDLLISLRNANLVFVLDPDSRDIKWHSTDHFFMQHDPDFTGGGWVGVFDNNNDGTRRGTVLGGSRIVALQPHTGSVKVQFPTQHSESFYTSHQGKWQELGNGNMLLTESVAGRVVEVDSTGRTVWEWVHEPYESKVPHVTGASRRDLTRNEVASWPCSSADPVRASTQGR